MYVHVTVTLHELTRVRCRAERLHFVVTLVQEESLTCHVLESLARRVLHMVCQAPNQRPPVHARHELPLEVVHRMSYSKPSPPLPSPSCTWIRRVGSDERVLEEFQIEVGGAQ